MDQYIKGKKGQGISLLNFQSYSDPKDCIFFPGRGLRFRQRNWPRNSSALPTRFMATR